MIEAVWVSDMSLCRIICPLRTNRRFFSAHHTCIEKHMCIELSNLCSLLFFLFCFVFSYFLFVGKEHHLSSHVHSGWRRSVCCKHRECRCGKLTYFTLITITDYILNVMLSCIYYLETLDVYWNVLKHSKNTTVIYSHLNAVLYIVCVDWLHTVSLFTLIAGHQIEEALRSAGKSQLFTRLSYPGAGHLIEPPYAPCARVSLWRAKPEKCELKFSSHCILLRLQYIMVNKFAVGCFWVFLFVCFSSLQYSLCGEVTPHPTLLLKKIPGRGS